MNFNLDRRCSDLLDALKSARDFCTVDSLSNHLNQTRRRTQYDISKLNDIFSLNHMPSIESRRNKGVKLLQVHRDWWDEVQSKHRIAYNYIYTQQERKDILLCESLLKDNVTTISDMAEQLGVSRNTVFLDIKELKDELRGSPVELHYVSKTGYCTIGDALYARRLFMYSLAAIYPLIEEGILNYMKGTQIDDINARLTRIEEDTHIRIREMNKKKISILIKYMESECPDIEDISEENEFYIAAKKYFPEYSNSNNKYIAIHLMGARRIEGVLNIKENSGATNKCAHYLVDNFEKRLGIEIENRELLLYNLESHLRSAIYRYKYGILDNYEIEKMVKSEIQELFDLMKMSAGALSKEIKYPINDSEIALLAVHFGAHMSHNQQLMEKAQAVLVTASQKQGKKLKHAIESNLPMIEICKIIGPDDLPDCDKGCIVLSTLMLKYNGFYSYISVELTQKDKKDIVDVYLRSRMYHEENMSDALFKSIQQYIPKEHQIRVKKILNDKINGFNPDLMQLIHQDSLQCIKTIHDWRRAISYAGRPLMNSGSIDRSYIYSVILNIETNGCFTHFGNGVLIANTQSVQNVKRSGISMLTIKNGVRMLGRYDVNLIVFMAAVDKNEHFAVMKELVALCNDEEQVKKMLLCNNNEELYNIIQAFVTE